MFDAGRPAAPPPHRPSRPSPGQRVRRRRRPAWLIDFGFAELAVDDGLLDADVAQVLAALAIVAGPTRPVTVAIDVLGRDVVASALPRLQLQALSGATRSALRARKGLLADLQHEVQRQTGVTEVRFVELERVDKKMVLMVAVLAAATYFLLPAVRRPPGDLPPDPRRQLGLGAARGADVAGHVHRRRRRPRRRGGVPCARRPARRQPGRLRLRQQAGPCRASAGWRSTCASCRSRASIGRCRCRRVGLSTVAGFVGHISLIGVFIIWAGRKAFGSFHLPDLRWFVVGIAAVVALVGAQPRPAARPAAS